MGDYKDWNNRNPLTIVDSGSLHFCIPALRKIVLNAVKQEKKSCKPLKTKACSAFLTFPGGFEPPAFRLGARRFAVASCRSVSVFVAGYGTFLRVRVDSCRFLSLTVLPCRRSSFSLILVFSKNGKRVAVEFKSFLAGLSVSGT